VDDGTIGAVSGIAAPALTVEPTFTHTS